MSPCRLPTFRSGTPWAVLSVIALVSPAAAAESKTLSVVVILADDVDECSERERPKTRK